jgi:hypothetical protein
VQRRAASFAVLLLVVVLPVLLMLVILVVLHQLLLVLVCMMCCIQACRYLRLLLDHTFKHCYIQLQVNKHLQHTRDLLNKTSMLQLQQLLL